MCKRFATLFKARHSLIFHCAAYSQRPDKSQKMKMFAGILLLILGAFAVGTSAFVDCDNPGSIESFPSDLLKKVPLKVCVCFFIAMI